MFAIIVTFNRKYAHNLGFTYDFVGWAYFRQFPLIERVEFDDQQNEYVFFLYQNKYNNNSSRSSTVFSVYPRASSSRKVMV